MRKQKIIIVFLLALLLITPFPVRADGYMTNTESNTTASTIVRLVIPSSYVVEIPAALSIPYAAESTPMAIGVSSIALEARQAVKIAVASARGKLLQTGGSAEIPFVLLCEGNEFASKLYASPEQTELNIVIALNDWFKAAAGEYAGTVTFQVSVAEQEVAP